MVEVRNNGVPLIEQAPRAGITQAIAALVENLTSDNRKPDAPDRPAPPPKPPRGSWLTFLGGKGKGK